MLSIFFCHCPPGRSGGHFSPHIDGPWVPHEDESSVFTVVVYLNADFDGGATNFISEDGVGEEQWSGAAILIIYFLVARSELYVFTPNSRVNQTSSPQVKLYVQYFPRQEQHSSSTTTPSTRVGQLPWEQSTSSGQRSCIGGWTGK